MSLENTPSIPKKHKQKGKVVEEEKKEKLTTSDSIINRLKWDPSLPGEDFVIGYLDRFIGIIESTMATHDWAEIPLHRIYYFKYKKLKVWDRNTRMDNISNGAIYKIIEEYDPDKIQAEDPQEQTDLEIFQDEPINEPDSSESESEKRDIIFSDKKDRHNQEQYEPDKLESWILNHHTNIPRQCIDNPTHVSQKGGHYHLPEDLNAEFIQVWSQCVLSGKKFFMEEVPTPLFRLFIDIDVKSTQLNDKQDIVEMGWLEIISRFTVNYFAKLKEHLLIDPTMTVTECHTNWEDAVTKTAKHKSGYRLYFHSIFVDTIIYKKYILSLAQYLESHIQEYENQPEGWTFLDVIDVKACDHPRARLFGSVKYRRGRVLNRRHSFAGVFGYKGAYDQVKSELFEKDLNLMLQHTMVRYCGQDASAQALGITCSSDKIEVKSV